MALFDINMYRALFDTNTYRSEMIVKAKRLLFQHLHSMKIFTVKPEQVKVIHADFTEDGFDVLFGIKKQYFDKELYEVCYIDDRINNTVTYTIQIYRNMYDKTCELPLESLTEIGD